MEPRTSATQPKAKRSGVQKKKKKKLETPPNVASKKPKRSVRSTTDSQSHAIRLQRASEIQATLSREYQSFIKPMEHSHVEAVYLLGLPKGFCAEHLPKENTVIVLEDENGKQYETRYLAKRTCLSGGWIWFSKDHQLIKGDVLVFHLIQPSKFKVYIAQPHEVDAANGLLHLHGSLRQQDSDVAQEPYSNSNKIICEASIVPSDQPENTSNIDSDENSGLQILNGRSVTTCQQVTNIDNFSVMVDGLVLDSQLPQHLKMKYYELCYSQRMFLHENVLGGQNYQLVVGMIYETVNIADDIKASKITTPLDSFALWHRKLKGLEMWGMNVNFLLVRLQQLMGLASKVEEYKEVRNNRERAKEQKDDLELKLKEVKETIRRLDGQIDSLNSKTIMEAEFQGLANAPWGYNT